MPKNSVPLQGPDPSDDDRQDVGIAHDRPLDLLRPEGGMTSSAGVIFETGLQPAS